MPPTTATRPATAGTRYTAFVQPGCTSCLRMKEFLQRNQVEFEVVDVMNDPDGRDRLLALGVRHVPVVSMGTEYAFGQDIADVARFVGVDLGGARRLAPEVLVQKWLAILTENQGFMRAMPAARLAQPPVPNRPISTLSHGYHVFRIGEAFLDTFAGRDPDWHQNAMKFPEAQIGSGEDAARYGDEVKARLAGWWRDCPDKSLSGMVTTFQGEQSAHWFLERSTWHSGQHARQIADVLERAGLPQDTSRLVAALEGLPLPERLWE
jgi:glutaredoxin